MSVVRKTLSLQEAATYVGMDVNAVRKWIKDGRIRTVRRKGNRVMVHRSSLDALPTNARPLSGKQLSLTGCFVNGHKVPPGFDKLSTYEELSEYTKGFAAGRMKFLLLVGSPGSGKSSHVKSDLAGAPHTWIDNHVSPQGLYGAAYKANNNAIVLDDVNHFFRNPTACSLMKALTQTSGKRVVSWLTTAKTLTNLGVPEQFSTTSQVCLIGNKWNGADPDMAAVQDRALGVAFYPSAETIHKQVKKLGWCDPTVWKFIGQNLSMIDQPSMRDYVHGMEYQLARMDWKKKLLRKWGAQ